MALPKTTTSTTRPGSIRSTIDPICALNDKSQVTGLEIFSSQLPHRAYRLTGYSRRVHAADRRIRPVRSFVRRSTRKNASQTKAWLTLRTNYVIPPTPGFDAPWLPEKLDVDLAKEFGREAPLIIEIGSGTGESLAAMAAARPEANVLAFEVFEPAIASTLSRLARESISNVRVIVADGVECLPRLIPQGTLTELWTFFPDPWHKARHHKRRLITSAFAQMVHERLRTGGRWLIATDWEEYRDWIAEAISTVSGLTPIPIELVGADKRPFGRPKTKFERRGIASGRRIHELAYAKVTP